MKTPNKGPSLTMRKVSRHILDAVRDHDFDVADFHEWLAWKVLTTLAEHHTANITDHGLQLSGLTYWTFLTETADIRRELGLVHMFSKDSPDRSTATTACHIRFEYPKVGPRAIDSMTAMIGRVTCPECSHIYHGGGPK